MHKDGTPLPPELWGCVFAFLPVASVSKVRLVCKCWLKISDDEGAWQKRVADDFNLFDLPAVENEKDTGGKTTWKGFYKSLAEWIWLPPGLDNVELSNHGRSVTANGGALLPAVSKQVIAITSGKTFKTHLYWEVTINHLGEPIGVGVGDDSFQQNYYYISNNCGIGYYSHSAIWSDSSDLSHAEQKRPPQYVTNDAVGILIDFEGQRLHFFRNREPVFMWVDMAWIWRNLPPSGTNLHICCMVGRGSLITLTFLGAGPSCITEFMEKSVNEQA